MKAEHRDYDDHIEFFISKKRFDEAIHAFKNPPSAINKPKRYTEQVIFSKEKVHIF